MKPDRKIGIGILLFWITAPACTPGGGGSTPLFLDSTARPTDTPPAVNEQLAAQAGLQKIIYHIGPVDLKAGTEPTQMLERPLVMRFQMDQPMWIIGFEPKVVDAHGNELSSSLLHHALLFNMHEENPICSSGATGNPFAAATSLLTKITFPEGYGYPILSTDPIESQVVLQNPTDRDIFDVYYEVTVLAKPMNEFVLLKDVAPVLIDFDPCTHATLEVPPGEFSKRQASYTLTETGSLIMAHGLLQNYGASVELNKGKEALPFWRAESRLDDQHQIQDLLNNPFEDPAGIPFLKGEAITVGVTYDNASSQWINEAFSGAMIYLAQED